jgi:predicted peptidase
VPHISYAGNVEPLTAYDVGRTTFYAARDDARVSYCLYVPERIQPDAGCVAVIHGTDRIAQWYRDAFAGVGEATGAIVVAPLFPAGLTAPYELESYKLLSPAYRSDRVLLGIMDEVGSRYDVDISRFALHGSPAAGTSRTASSICTPNASIPCRSALRGWSPSSGTTGPGGLGPATCASGSGATSIP